MKRTPRSWNSTLRAGPPLARKAKLRVTQGPLRQATLAPRRDPDRRRQGMKAAKLETWRTQERNAVHMRSWRCESTEFCTDRGVHVHHTFGRLGEPWASSQLVGLNLCFGHHGRAHSDARYGERLRWLAITRLSQYLAQRVRGIYPISGDMIRNLDPRATYESLIAKASAAGIGPPGWREE